MVSKLDFLLASRVCETQFLWFDHVWCDIFFMWRPHGNRVSKTRFITLINKNKSEKNHQNIRERKKKKKTETKRERRSRSEWVALDRLQTTVHDPGRVGKVSYFSPSELFLSLWSESLGLGLLCLGFLKFVFGYFGLYMRLRIFLNFFGLEIKS